jgi:hypothetical protein
MAQAQIGVKEYIYLRDRLVAIETPALFSVSVSPSSTTVEAGESAQFAVALSPGTAFTQDVTAGSAFADSPAGLLGVTPAIAGNSNCAAIDRSLLVAATL